MPTYEYKCDACGHAFEKFQSIKASPVRKCPKCGKLKVKKLISKGAGLIFKGSGFYITDYRSEGYKDQAKAEGGGDSKEGQSKEAQGKEAQGKEARSDSKETGKTDGKGDAKPAADAPTPAKSEGKSESKPAAQPNSKANSKPESKAESKPSRPSSSDK